MGDPLVRSAFLYTDINECARADQLRCQQICFNTIGSYNCSCEDGYLLQEDGLTCEGTYKCQAPLK